MANEYGDLEQLVNDVTSLDTARMTLRWALERLQNIEKEKADLKKNLTLAEETAKRLQLKESSLTDAYASRSKTLEEKEDFYGKLEATMSLLGEGKLDIQQLLKKEAKLDSLRHSLEDEYQGKFEELDRNQRAVIERWNARLLEVEGQFAGRIAESQKKYDSLRAELEAEHQGRLTALQNSFKAREKDLTGRIELLEGSVHLSEEKVEARRRELEAEYLAKKREAEENYRKLRNLMEQGLEEKLRAADSDHAAQVTALGASWQAERSRLLEEQRLREEQFVAAQNRIKEIENGLAAQQDAHHSELLKMIAEKETAFRAQLQELEKEKAAQERSVRELSAALEQRAAGWEAEKASLRAGFEARLSAAEAALRDREAGFEKEYAARKEELYRVTAAERGGLEKELESRLASERRDMAAERERLVADRARLEAALAAATDKITGLENTVSSLREEHRGELMQRVSETEAAFRDRLAAFESERGAYVDTIKKLEDKAHALESSAAHERGTHAEALSRISAEAAARLDERSSELKAAYEAMSAKVKEESAAALESYKVSLSAAAQADQHNREAERARLEEALEHVTADFNAAQVEIVGLHTRLRKAAEDAAARESALTGELIAAKGTFEKDISERVSQAVLAQTAALDEALRELKAERNSLASALERKESEITALKAETEMAERNFETKLFADSSKAAEARMRDLDAAFASKHASLEADFAARRQALESEIAIKNARITEENAALKSALEKIGRAASEANARAADLAEKLLNAEKVFHSEKLEMQKMQVREFDSAVSGAVNAAVELSEQRLKHAHEEQAKVQREYAEELRILEEANKAEKARLMEEMDRRDRYIEGADIKIQDLEREMMQYRQNATGELMKQISEQDRRFREAAATEKERSEARQKQLEDLLEAKEKLQADREKMFRQKELELAALNEEFNKRMDAFNEELFMQKRVQAGKEREMNEFRLGLEKEYALKAQELEKMKAELTRAIMEYRKDR